MGTIADLLGGLDISAFSAEEPQEASSQADADSADSQGSVAEEVVMAALLEHTSLQPEESRADLTLRGDLDMDDLQLYAVVVQIERELKTTFPDELIDQWQVIGDIMDAVSR